MTRGLVTTSRYSPGNLTPAALERTFVGRDAVLDDVLGRVRASMRGRGKHYTLLVGPRGSGKTHFMALLRHRLLAEHHGKLRLAALNEEEWGVASFLDFLVRILRSLSITCPDRGIETGIDVVYGAYTGGERAAEEEARKLLRRVVGDGTLVVLCENLSDLFEGLGEEGQQRLRAAIQDDGFWTIVATTPALFSDVQLQTSPFYGFFTVRKLDSLDFETGLELLVRKARFENKSDLATFLATAVGRARARAIHYVTGGNHRAYVIMSEFLTTETLDQLVDPFMKMIDDLTPYYQDRMRQLAPFQRKLIEYLCTEAAPVPVKKIASRCLASPQSTAKQIGELHDLGFVRRNRVGRETLCELTEPLMRICIEVKDNRTEHVELFVQFLRRWFSGDELRSKLDVVMAVDATKALPVQRRHLEAAVRAQSKDVREPFLDALDQEAERCWRDGDNDGVIEAARRVPPTRRSAHAWANLVEALADTGQLDQARAEADAAREKHPESLDVLCARAQVLAASGKADDALAEIDGAVTRFPREPLAWWHRLVLLHVLGRVDLVVENQRRLIELGSPNTQRARRELVWALIELNRLAEAVAESKELVEHGHELPESAVLLARALARLDRRAEALEVLESHRDVGQSSASFHELRGALLSEARRYEDALDSAERRLRLEPENGAASKQKVDVLLALDRVADAEALLLATPAHVWGDTGALALVLERCRERGNEQAIVTLTAHVLALPDATASVVAKCELLSWLDRHAEANTTASRWLDEHPLDAPVRRMQVRALLQDRTLDQLAKAMERVVAVHPRAWDAWVGLGCARLGLDDPAGAEASFLHLLEAPGSERPSFALASELLMEAHRYGSAVRIAAHASHVVRWNPELAVLHAKSLLAAGEHALASSELARAKELGATPSSRRPLDAWLACATKGLHAACAIAADQDWSQTADLEPWAAEMMLVEAKERGPRSLVASVSALRDLVMRAGGDSAVAGALTRFVKLAITRGLPKVGAWAEIAEGLRAVFGGSECELPLRTLDVAVRHVSGEEGALLELPLEERRLLEEALSVSVEDVTPTEEPAPRRARRGRGGSTSRRVRAR